MKRFILMSLIISVIAGITFAQVDVPGTAFTSPQSAATAGRLRSTADNFIRADAYVDVKFDKFFAMASYQSAPGTALFGYAGKAGDLYVGLYYGGTLWANIPNITYTESTGTWVGVPNSGDVKSYNSTNFLGSGAPNNTLSLLFGFANMGVRASLYTNKKIFSDIRFAVGTDYYISYETESGVVTPQLLWSMTKNLTDNGIKPYLALDMAFTKNYTKINEYYLDAGIYVADQEVISQSDNNILTRIRAGLGGYTLFNKNGFRFSTDLDYDLRLTSYDNDYNYADSNGKLQIITGFKGTVTNPSNPTAFVESSLTQHTINPSFSGQWSGGPLSLRFKLNMNVNLSDTISTEKSFQLDAGNNPTTNGALARNGTDSKATMIGFNPDLRLAAQWKITPKLALNLGGRINFNSITSTTTEGKSYINDNEVDNSSFKTVVTANPATISNTLAMGVTINATDNLTFEVASGATNGTIDVFGTSGGNSLLYFTNLLFSLRY
jgi:hypothetical protein